MKTLIHIAATAVTALLLSASASVWAGMSPPGGLSQSMPAPGINKGMVPKVYGCPTGWHLKNGSFIANSTTVCVPNKPASINCPPGTNPFIGDCEVGCMQIPK